MQQKHCRESKKTCHKDTKNSQKNKSQFQKNHYSRLLYRAMTEKIIPDWVFKTRINLPLSMKVKISKLRIWQWYSRYLGNVHVSFSGGKDSLVLLHLAREVCPDIKAVYFDTGLEYPENKSLVKSYPNVEIFRPKRSFEQIITEYGWPIVSKRIAQYIYDARYTGKNQRTVRLRLTGMRDNDRYSQMSCISKKWLYLYNAPFPIADRCCGYLKKEPAKLYEKLTHSMPIVGMRATESKNRELNYLSHGCNAFSLKRPMSTPLAFWTEQDVLKYLYKKGIKLSKIYGKIAVRNNVYSTTGVQASGCMFCGFGAHLEPTPNRFQRMKLTHPKHYAYIINKLGMGEILDYIRVPYE